MSERKIIDVFPIDREEINEMARIGFIPPEGVSGIDVYVYTDDPGKIPHFHVRKSGKNNKIDWDVCVRFDRAEYFKHGIHQGTLPTKLCKELQKMLKSIDKHDDFKRTYWEIALDEWNRNNSDVKLDKEELRDKQPDYSKLNRR